MYAVDKFTLLIKDFIYDGNGRDTYFMVGVSNQPGRKGDIVPNEFGKTNVLQRYLNEEFTLTMPNGKIRLIYVKICLNFLFRILRNKKKIKIDAKYVPRNLVVL